MTIENTAVVPEGRITYGDMGSYNDESESAIGRVLEAVHRWSRMPVGIQLSHAGRKSSTEVPWKAESQLPPSNPLGWQTVAPSALPFEEGEIPPSALSKNEMRKLRDAFVASAVRANRLGLDLMQVHGAHGYLLHQFLSPLSNHRSDEYGGTLENRMRFPLEVFDAVRQVSLQKSP